MKLKTILLVLAGSAVTLFGLLWFLQGSDLIHIKPILCAANCQPVTGHSPLWQTAGAIACAGGILLIRFALKNAKTNAKNNK